MRRILILIFAIFLTISAIGQEKKVLRGFDGGMMLHTGYLSGKIPGIGFSAKGAPLGIGGVARLCLGSHFRVGGEGYVSTLHQLRNGSYVKYGWGGLLADYSHRIGRFVPYAGLTIGGGSASGLIINEFSGEEWGELQDASYGKQVFFRLGSFPRLRIRAYRAHTSDCQAGLAAYAWKGLGTAGRTEDLFRIYFLPLRNFEYICDPL